LIIWTIS